MALVQRYDAPNPQRITRLETGGIRVEAGLSRTGVQRYIDANGKERHEYRPPEEVFAPESIASFKGVPVTIGHPSQFLTPDNYKQLQVGHVGDDLHQDGEILSGSIVVQDRHALDAIDTDALHDGSCGYTLEIDETPGITPSGEHYDAIQRNIRGNHWALVPKGQGRGGPKVAMRLDSTLSSVAETIIPMSNTPISVPGVEHSARVDQLEGELRAKDAMIAQLKASLAQAKDPKRLDSMVAERTALLAVAMPILGAEYRVDGKSPDAVRRDVVAKALPEEHIDGKSSDYIMGLFKGIVSAAEKAPAPGLSSVRVDALHASPIGLPRAEPNGINDAYQRRLRADAERCQPPGGPRKLSTTREK